MSFFVLSIATAAAPSEYQPAKRLSFDEAVRVGMARYIDSQVARLQIERAAGLLEQARAASLPTLLGTASYTRLDGARVVSGKVADAQNQLAADALLTIPLVVPVAWAQWSQARTLLEVTQTGELQVRRQVGIVVARAYLAVITQTRLLEVSQHAVDTSREHFDFAHQRYAGGVGNQLDELRAAQELATGEVQLHGALAALVQARETLGVVTGFDVACDVDSVWPLPDVPTLAEIDDRASYGRPDIRLLKDELRAAEQIHGDSWLDYLPSLLATAEPFYEDPPMLTVPLKGWQAQLILSVPFYDGGARYGVHKQRQAAVEEARASLDFALLTARSQVRAAFALLVHAQDALEAAQRGNGQAKGTIVLTASAYREGSTDNLQVIDAERRGRDADTAAIAAEDTVRRARLDVLIAAGRFPE